MRPFWVYILRCADGSYYVGHTDDLAARMDAHDQGGVGGYTARRLPVEIVYHCEFATREEALARELQLKGWSRAKKEALMRGDWDALRVLSRRRPSTPALRASAQGERGGGRRAR